MGNSEKPPIKITRVPNPVQGTAPAREPAKGAPVKISFTTPPPAAPQPKRIAPKPQIEALTALYRAGRLHDALEAARAMSRDYPDTMAGWNIAGASARALGLSDEAETAFRKLEQLRPDFAGGPYNLGLVLEDKGDRAGAEAAYRRAIAADPSLAQALNNLGSLLTKQRRLDEALERLEQAARLRPDLAEVHNSLGNALKLAERYEEAKAAYHRAVKVRPDFTKAVYNYAVLEQERGDAQVALQAFAQVLRAEPDNDLALSHLVYQLAQFCDWDTLDDYRAKLADLGVSGEGVPPWPMLGLEDHPERQLARARKWAKRRFKDAPAPAHARPKARPDRLKICYFSGDFHDHASMHLMAGMLASHDRDRFEVHAFSYGEHEEDAYRRKARQCVEHFHDVARDSNQSIIERARAVGFDIVLDRKGYSRGTRNEILQARLAPVQVNYLAYPGTLGADFIDYIVADPLVVPGRYRDATMEKLIRLPHCYLPSDNHRPIANSQTRREDFGLPPRGAENGFVFCSFNATYKITPAEFDIWMRVMRKVEGSVLWLFRSNRVVASNLRRQAEVRGVDGGRLVFADRLPNPDHLARHAHADLFLDTFAMNAHTTANDALWAGLPLVTMEGRQFAARVASSLLHAVGLPELVTRSPDEYEELILALASDPARLSAIRQKLSLNRHSHPLFDTQLYTRHFEAGMTAAWERWFAGDAPADIIVPA